MDELDDLIARLENLTQEAFASVGDQLAAAHVASTLSDPIEATDDTRSVTVRTSSGAVPDVVRMAHGWQAKGIAQLDSTIMAVYAEALGAVWNAAKEHVETVDDDGYREYLQSSEMPDYQFDDDYWEEQSEKSQLDELALILELAQNFKPTRSAADSEGLVSFSVGLYGLTDCKIDQRWAESVGVDELNTVIVDSLRRASKAQQAISEDYVRIQQIGVDD